MTPREETREFLPVYEAVKKRSYICPAGFLTLGIGHNLEASPLNAAEKLALGIPEGVKPQDYTISREGAFWLLDLDIEKCEAQLKGLIPSDIHPRAREIVLRMVFQMGAMGVKRFRKMLLALGMIPTDYQMAAREMRDSKWHREDSPNRAEQEAKRMESLSA